MFRQSSRHRSQHTGFSSGRGRPFRQIMINTPLQSSRYINRAASAEPQEPIADTGRFLDFALRPELQQAVERRGYVTPTPIQHGVIPHILTGKDVVGVANTGTGKTAAFLLPLLQKVLDDRSQKILIMAPTRELAVQIHDELRSFIGDFPIHSALVIGGANMNNQLRMLKQNPNFLVSTPGRLKDFAKNRLVRLLDYHTVVLDEVDRMLDIGFIADIRFLMSLLPTPRQSLFFSATVSPAVSGVIRSFTTDPVMISVKVKETAHGIDQDVIHVRSKEEKMTKLYELLKQAAFNKVLIFGRTKWSVERLARALLTAGFSAGSIHGNKSQNQRLRVLTDFKRSRVRILVATDVASRGLDIDDVSHVINFDEPATYDDYVHRIGRTGRANKAGKALTFVG